MAEMKSVYHAELSETRRLLDETSKEKAQLQLEVNKVGGILAELRPKFDHEVSSNKHLSAKLRNTERSLAEKELLLTTYMKEKTELESRVGSLESQVGDLETKLAADKEQLEKEIIARIDVENKYQTLKEESQFQLQVYQKEISEVRKSAAMASAIHIDCTSDTDYEGMVHSKLQELREEFFCEAESAKQELETAYNLRYTQFKEQADKDRSSISKLMVKQSDMMKVMEEVRCENSQLRSKYEHSEKHVQELNTMRMKDKEEFKTHLEEYQATNAKLQGSYERLQSEYESLLGIKIRLDMELAAYNKLLEGGEQRFHIHSSSSSSEERVSRKRSFRQATAPVIESSATGPITFGDVEMNGKFVTITNTGTADAEMAGFMIQRTVDGAVSSNTFTFPCHYVLPAQQSITVWGASHGMEANPPSEYVLEGDWSSGGLSVGTSVLNGQSEVIAQHTVTMTTSHEMQTRSKKSSSESCQMM